MLNLGLPLSIVSNAKNFVENENYRLKSMRVNKNDPTDPFVVEALTDLRRLKSKAVEKEDFIEARRLKSIILQAMKLSKRITTLQNMEKASETSKQIATASDTLLRRKKKNARRRKKQVKSLEVNLIKAMKIMIMMVCLGKIQEAVTARLESIILQKMNMMLKLKVGL